MSDDGKLRELRREMEWNRKRHDEAQRELRRAEDLIGEAVTPDVVERELRFLLETLRRHGEETLASATQAAYERQSAALANLERVNDAMEEKLSVTDLEHSSAYDESNRAQFDWERVLADVTEWFDVHDPDSSDE